jgi:DNA-binding transcriptional regulator YbjK
VSSRPSNLAQWVSRPRGQLQLIAATFVAAVLLASVAAWQRPYFESLVREKYSPILDETRTLATAVEAGSVGAASVDGRVDALYELWVQTPDVSSYSKLPGLVAQASPVRVAVRIERTLVGGSKAQRLRAAAFLCAARHPELAAALELGERSAASKGDIELLEALRPCRTTPAG